MIKSYHLHSVDLSNWIHRAYHVAPPHLSVRGKPTGAVSIFINMVESMLGDIRESAKPNEAHYVVFAIDCPRANSWRYKLVKEWADKQKSEKPADLYYKGKRSCDEEKRKSIRFQIKLAIEMVKTAGFLCLGDEDSEADDVLGTIAYNFRRYRNVYVHIHTRDKDAAQLLVHRKTSIVHPATGAAPRRELLTAADCVEVYGVLPNQIVDYLTMLGDTADNVPGIAGVGHKTAVKLLEQYGSLDRLLRSKKGVKSVKTLRENKLTMPIPMMVNLIKLDCHVSVVPKSAREFARAPMDSKRVAALTALRRKYKFNSLFGA